MAQNGGVKRVGQGGIEEDRQEIWRALCELSEQDREILVMRYIDQLAFAEIAASMNDSAPTGWAPLSADVTGAGTVTAIDLTLATRSMGRKLAPGLPAERDWQASRVKVGMKR